MPAPQSRSSYGLAEAMGIKIRKTVVVQDHYLGTTFDAWQSVGRLIERKNHITLSAGDGELDPDFWQATHAADISAAHAEIFARAA